MRSSPAQSRTAGWLKFVVLTSAVLIVWGFILPGINEEPEIASRIIELQSKGIDPSAMYYTDLEILEEISFRAENARKEDRENLWK